MDLIDEQDMAYYQCLRDEQIKDLEKEREIKRLKDEQARLFHQKQREKEELERIQMEREDPEFIRKKRIEALNKCL